MTSAKSYCLKLAAMVAVFVCLFGQAQASGLSEENIRNFYNEMIVMNTTLKEGRDDLPVFLAYLDRTLADDFRHISKFHETCAATPAEGREITKQQLLDIYRDIGVDNFDTYDLSIETIEIAEEAQTAVVHYTLHIEDVSGGSPFITTCKAHASLVWDGQSQSPRIKEQECDQAFAIGTEKKLCKKSE